MLFAASSISSSEQIRFSSFYVSFPSTSPHKTLQFSGTKRSLTGNDTVPLNQPIRARLSCHSAPQVTQTVPHARSQGCCDSAAQTPRSMADKPLQTLERPAVSSAFSFGTLKSYFQKIPACILDVRGRKGWEVSRPSLFPLNAIPRLWDDGTNIWMEQYRNAIF